MTECSARQDFYWAGVRDYMHFQPDLIRMAAKVVRRVLDAAGGPYNALHYRSTDWRAARPSGFELHAFADWHVPAQM